MSAAIQPGDYIVCVRGGRGIGPLDEHFLETGKTYKCVELAQAREGKCGLCKSVDHFYVVVDHPPKGGWCPTRFRPVYRPKASKIAEIMAPAPALPHEILVDA